MLLIFTHELNRFTQAVICRIVTGISFRDVLEESKLENILPASRLNKTETLKELNQVYQVSSCKYSDYTRSRKREAEVWALVWCFLVETWTRANWVLSDHSKNRFERTSSVLCTLDLWPWNFSREGVGRKVSIWLQSYSSVWPSVLYICLKKWRERVRMNKSCLF